MSGPSERKFPSFLGIGAPRAGTTWLHTNLKRHPQLWLPPLKELHYFDYQRPGASSYYPVPDVRVRLMSWWWWYRHSKQILGRLVRFRARFRWTMRYVFGRRNDRWYASLFRTDRISGEITPGYMMMPRHVVEDVCKLNPDMKIILLLRNPVSRAWSNVRLQLGRRTLTVTDEEIVRLMNKPGVILRNDYVNAVRNWRGVFGEKQVFVGFFDDLVANPRDLLRSVLSFLGVEKGDDFIPEKVEQEVHASTKRDLPESVLAQVYAPYVDQLRELEKLVGGPVGKWLAKAEEAVGRTPAAV
jgi:hypothetical protein